MAMRAYWKGHIRLSLVTVGVELYSAVERSGRLTLHQIHKPSGKRVRHEKVVPGIGPVDADDIVKGFAVDGDEYVLIEPEELDALKLETRRTIELVQFVDAPEIDPRYFEKPYYVVPADDEVAQEGFSVIRDALRKAGKVGLGQMAARGRDYVVAVKPCGDGLLLETLRYADEIRRSDRVFADIPDRKLDKEMLDLAGELIERKSAPFEPENFRSQYAEAMRELIEEKRSSGKVVAGSGERRRGKDGDNVVDLMDALKKSVDKGKKSGGGKRQTSGRGGRKKAAG
ncbi:Ku protein [Minwuia thermotolerans]|nr:Ku protein [Minwuia thermotolerans]